MKAGTVFVSGNFNVLHPGHLRLLRFAKEYGAHLTVGVVSDRLAGTAEAQAHMVHVGREYDIEVDTSTDTPEVCCARIRDFLKRNPSGPARAFDRLRTRP